MAIEAGIRVGKYEVGRQLGKGSFGILYAARDTELGRDIAIKFLRPEHAFRQQVMQRFLQEAKAAARIQHAGIVTVFETGVVAGTNTRADGTLFIAMELLNGKTLAARMAEGRVSTKDAINYTTQIASALGAAHQAGIVHRDLKPANVFLVPDPAVVGGERVKVLDFGIAKLVDDFGDNVQTHSMLMLGTPMYMSPEQCKSSAKVDARADIYSLGCMLFQLVAGKPPFAGDSGELIAMHQLVPPPTPRSFNKDVPESLDRLITSMLAKSPDDRPQTMGMVEDALADDPPTRLDARAVRSRIPLLAGASGAIAIGVTVGLLSMCGHKDAPTAQAKEVPAVVAPSDAALVVEVAPPPDAAPASPTLVTETSIDCQQLVVDKDWARLADCAKKLVVTDKKAAKKFVLMAEDESKAEVVSNQLLDAVKKKDRTRAKKLLGEIPEGSVYHHDAERVLASLGQPTVSPPAREEPSVPTACDADALKDKGMENVNMGQHAAALAQFEASLRCKSDPYVVSLAFMAACNAQNAGKAKLYYGKLDADQQRKLDTMCVRNRIRTH